MKLDEKDYLAHYGILRKSGRYPWGSGNSKYQRSIDFLATIDELRKSGMSDPAIAKSFHRKEAPFTTTHLRALTSIAVNERRQNQINQVNRLSEKGLSNVAIGERMGLNESTVRSLRAYGERDQADILTATSDMLRRQVEKKGAIDVGTKVEQALPLSSNQAQLVGISDTKFRTAIVMLEQEGYKVHYVKVPQLGVPGNFTTIKVLARPDVQWKDLITDPAKIKLISEKTDDGGRTFVSLKPPLNISSKRIKMVYDEDGGSTKDGLIEIRPGAKDLDMGRANYAQVRIAVDGTHYLKGMAIYNPDLPAGTDLRFNTNKSKKDGKMNAMKENEKDSLTGKVDPLNPFNASIKPNGQRGALNIIYEEGDWDKFRKVLPSQMLSKQDPKLAKTQLDLTYDRQKRELDAILALTNPAVKRQLLKEFSDGVDASAVELEAASRPKQSTKVLIPVNSVKPDQIYAPDVRDGTRVSLVRFPHGGTFEIPELTVNNRNPEARRLLGNAAKDAVGIHHTVADRLSGADFDGDHVLVIPNDRREVKSRPPLQGLKDFDPRSAHPPYDGMPTVDGGRYNAKTKKVEYKPGQLPNKVNMQNQMGVVSNLITDMTIKGANDHELAAAVRHSMVVIDSEKHALDIKGSYKDNGILNLKKKYQQRPDGKPGGAATLLSRAGAPTYINKRKPRPAAEGGPIDRKTGKKVFVDTGESYTKDGQVITRKVEVERLSITDDAHTLVSFPGTPIEKVYANHSNKLKSLGDQARKEMVNTKNRPMSDSAKKVYKREVESLDAKLRLAESNAPLERQAQAVANSIARQKKQANPNLTKEKIRKIERQALQEARLRTGAKKNRIGTDQVPFTQEEWNAIQAGAISNHKLERILKNAESARVRELATPRDHKVMTSSKTARAQAMLAQGYTQAEVADALGVALSTLKLSLA